MIPIPQPPCPKCRSKTMLTRIAPGVTGFDFRTFECPVCEYVHKILVALVDPMQSDETSGWLQGELRAPT
jgi:hypothetical protein